MHISVLIQTRHLFHWRKQYYGQRIFARGNGLKFKHALMMDFFRDSFLFRKTLINGPQSCGLLIDYCNVFVSCLGSHSDGTHFTPLVRK